MKSCAAFMNDSPLSSVSAVTVTGSLMGHFLLRSPSLLSRFQLSISEAFCFTCSSFYLNSSLCSCVSLFLFSFAAHGCGSLSLLLWASLLCHFLPNNKNIHIYFLWFRILRPLCPLYLCFAWLPTCSTHSLKQREQWTWCQNMQMPCKQRFIVLQNYCTHLINDYLFYVVFEAIMHNGKVCETQSKVNVYNPLIKGISPNERGMWLTKTTTWFVIFLTSLSAEYLPNHMQCNLGSLCRLSMHYINYFSLRIIN